LLLIWTLTLGTKVSALIYFVPAVFVSYFRYIAHDHSILELFVLPPLIMAHMDWF